MFCIGGILLSFFGLDLDWIFEKDMNFPQPRRAILVINCPLHINSYFWFHYEFSISKYSMIDIARNTNMPIYNTI